MTDSRVIHVLKYMEGDYVQVDNSSGPMSSGGYPQRTTDIDKATQWVQIDEATRYAQMFKTEIQQVLFPIRIDYSVLNTIDISERWIQCNRHCAETAESTAPEAKHYLNCPVWKKLL